MGTIREDFDKHGQPAQVYDCIWHPSTIDRCFKEPSFRQSVVELAFTFINQKYKHELDIRFTMPKMSYKGAHVETQRVKGKKAPKIVPMA